MVECGGLEIRYGVKPIGGSNPPLSVPRMNNQRFTKIMQVATARAYWIRPMMTGAIALLALCNSCALVPSSKTSALSSAWPEPVSQSEGDRSPFLPKRLPQDPQIQVYFNHTPTTAFTDPYRRIRRPGDDLEALIAAQINQATRSVDVAVQELRLPRIAEALVNRHRAGVRVRVIVENQYRQPWSAYSPQALEQLPPRERSRIRDYQKLGDRNGDQIVSPEEADRMDTMRMLARAQVPTIDDRADGSKGSGLMHHKFVIVDHHRAVPYYTIPWL